MRSMRLGPCEASASGPGRWGCGASRGKQVNPKGAVRELKVTCLQRKVSDSHNKPDVARKRGLACGRVRSLRGRE